MRRTNFLYLTTLTTALFIAVVALFQCARTGMPSADVIAKYGNTYPQIKVSDFEPGEVRILRLNKIPIVVWRRSKADMELARTQNDPSQWRQQYSNILGKAESVFADDANLTLDHEWFFGVAILNESQFTPVLRAGDFGGFFEVKYAGHFDLSGRIRKQGFNNNMTVVLGKFSKDKQSIVLDLNKRLKVP